MRKLVEGASSARQIPVNNRCYEPLECDIEVGQSLDGQMDGDSGLMVLVLASHDDKSQNNPIKMIWLCQVPKQNI